MYLWVLVDLKYFAPSMPVKFTFLVHLYNLRINEHAISCFYVDCCTRFVGSTRCVREITSIFHRWFDGPYTSYGDVPIHVRDMWFDEFSVS
jgi:hypothetical protein